MIAGSVAEAIAWWLVAFRRASVWVVLTPLLVLLGAAAIVVGPPAWSPDVAAEVALAAGLVAGVALFGATRVFLGLVRDWDRFERDAVRIYLRRGPLSLGGALLLSLLLSVPGEELFWRGLVRSELVEAFDGSTGIATLAGYALFVLANLPSANLAVIASAVVGGAIWTVLAVWTGGVLAALACHAVWTGLMLGFPAVRVAEEAA